MTALNAWIAEADEYNSLAQVDKKNKYKINVKGGEAEKANRKVKRMERRMNLMMTGQQAVSDLVRTTATSLMRAKEKFDEMSAEMLAENA